MQTDSTQLAPPPQAIQKPTSQQELEMNLMQNNPQMWREMQEYRLRERAHDFDGNSLVPVFEMFIPLTLFVVTGIVLIKFFQNRHQERMQIIERGLDPVAYKELYSMPKFKSGNDIGMGSLKWGLLAIFVGLGIFVGDMLYSMTGRGPEAEFYYPAAMLVCGGIGLLVYYNIAKRKVGFDKEPLKIEGQNF